MRGVVGEINDSCYMQFLADVQGVSDCWNEDKTIVKGSSSYSKGKFKSTKGSIDIPERCYVNYKDVVNSVQIILVESKLAPKSKIKVNLPTPDKYNVSEFFVEGYFDIERVNVLSQSKSVNGLEKIMPALKQGNRINLMDKIFIEKTGDPILKVDTIETPFGSIVQIKNRSNIEI